MNGEKIIYDDVDLGGKGVELLKILKEKYPGLTEGEIIVVLKSAVGIVEAVMNMRSIAMMTANFMMNQRK